MTSWVFFRSYKWKSEKNSGQIHCTRMDCRSWTTLPWKGDNNENFVAWTLR